jgi:hypothetical protein
LREPRAELLVEGVHAGELIGGRKRMQRCELRPRDRDHLAGGVELHRARAERDHRAVERQILVGQAADVAQHLGLAVVRVEYRMGEVAAGAAQRSRNQRLDAFLVLRPLRQRLARGGEPRPQRADVAARRGLVERDADLARRHQAQIGLRVARLLQDRFGARAGLERDGVERLRREVLESKRCQTLGEDCRVRRHALRDAPQALRPVVHGVHAGDHRQQHLRGADVRRGLLAPDVLLARLQREAISRLAVAVDAGADQPAGHRALELVAAGEKRRVRSAATHRHAKTLRVADHDVGIELARCLQQREREQIGRDDERGLLRMRLLDERREVMDQPRRRWVLRQHGEVIVLLHQLGCQAHEHLQAERLGARAHHVDRLRVAVARDDDRVALAAHAALGQGHCLGGCGGLVEHRCVGHRHAGEVAHQGLEVDQRFQPALRDLRLIRRVGGVPGRVLEDVSLDHAGCQRAVVALADERLEDLVARRQRLELLQRLCFAHRGGQLHRHAARDRARHDRIDQRLARCRADHRQHVPLLIGIGADVAGGKQVGVFEFGERRAGRHQHGGWGRGNRGEGGRRSQSVFSSLS